MQETWFIGCDMGGWHTNNGDAVAVCRWDGHTLSHMEAWGGAIFYPVADELAAVIAHALRSGARVVVGIDAALGWPVSFLNLATQAGAATHLPAFNRGLGQYHNPYLYRTTERFVRHVLNKQPLTAPGDKFGNNSSKAQALVAWFQQQIPSLYRPPFHPWSAAAARDAIHTLIEVYPGASMLSPAFQALQWPALDLVAPAVAMNDLGEGDVADAKRAAMTAACYAGTVGIPAPAAPAVCLPVGLPAQYGPADIAAEGWIFAPPGPPPNP